VRALWRGLQSQFVARTAGVVSLEETEDFMVRFMNVDTGGKSRSVTVAEGDQVLLGPLHRLAYDHLSKTTSWLLRGEASKAKFGPFVRVPGEVFTSGDYEAATDNLCLEVAECILGVLEERALHVPRTVFAYGRRSLRATVEYPLSGGTVRFKQVRGQLMGNLLSFPLLCLQNYVSFRWCVSRSVVPDDLLRINGDDIVFRSSKEVSQRWMESVSATGLKLCAGKTMVSATFFSLNSTFFKALPTRVVLVPVVRSQCLATELAELAPHALGPGCATFCRGFRGSVRVALETLYLRWRRPQIMACGRSIVRDLGVRVSLEALKASGLADFEAWCLTMPRNPLPPDETRLGGAVPEGWVRVPASTRAERKRGAASAEEFGDLLRERAWNGDPVPRKTLGRSNWSKAVSSGYFSQWRWWNTRRRGRVKRTLGVGPYTAKAFREAKGREPTSLAAVPVFGDPTWVRVGGAPNSFLRVGRAFVRPDLVTILNFTPPKRVTKVWLKREECAWRRGVGFSN